MTYSKILIAIDSSEYSLNAANNGIAPAKQLNAEAALIFVVDTSKTHGNVDAGIMPEEALLILKREAENSLDQIAAMHKDFNVLKFMPEGRPKEDILKTAETWEANLIVMGTHGRSGLVHLLLGSVAEFIMKHSKVPVMVAPFQR